MKNIETKIILGNFQDMIRRLKEIKVQYKGRFYQIDIYYFCNSGRLKIREINKRNFEIIFYQRPNKSKSKISNYQVIKINRQDAQKIKKIFSKIFGEKITIRKWRELWMYKHTRIHLDSVRKTGKFLELETVMQGITLKKAESEHKQIIKILDLSKYERVKNSYSDLRDR